MSVEELAPSMVSHNMEPDICRDWMRKNKEEIKQLEKTVERISGGSSADESEEEPEHPPVAVRRKVSFADAFGLDLVSVKEYDSRDTSRPDADGREGEEYYISCLFTIPVLNQGMEVRLQQQKLELERFELLPGSSTIRGIVRVLNLCFHKAVYIRVSLDGWQSHSELQAEYVPGSSDGQTDRFSFVLTPPFRVEGVRMEFCLRYESDAGTFWDNNGGTNYIVFCHQRRTSDQREKEKESEREKLVEESNQKSIRSCLKTISKNIYTEATPAEASGEISEQVTPKREEEAGITSCKSLTDCCKTLVDRRRKRQAARLAHVQDYFAQKAMEIQNRCNSNTNESTTSIPRPSRTDSPDVHSRQGYGMDTPHILMYHQIPLLSLDWGSTTTTTTTTTTPPPHVNPPDAYSEKGWQVEDHLAKSTSDIWKAFLNSTDTTHTHSDIQEKTCSPTETLCQSEVIDSKDKVILPLEDKRAEKDNNHESDSGDMTAMETVRCDPTEQSKGPSRNQVLGYPPVNEPRLTTVPCSALGSEPERVGREFEASRDRQAPHHEHTRGSLSQDTTKASPGDETRTAHDTETQNSEAGDGISPEECTGSFDTSKVKENTHRAVKDTLTFTGIRDASLTNRQAEGSSSEREDINKDDSEEQVEMRELYREVHEEETESSRKGRDETTTDHSAEIQSDSSRASEAFNESELCMSNKNLNKDNSELLKIEERRFEANEGLKINETPAKDGESAEKCSETKRELVEDNRTDGEDKEFELLKVTSPTVSTDPSEHLLQTTPAKKSEVTSPEQTLRNFQEPQRLNREGEHPLPSMHLSWVDGSSRVLSWWREFCSMGHMAKALVYAILFVIFITAYLYDLPTWLGLSVFSALVVQPGHEAASGWGC